MAPPKNTQSPYNEADIILAISALDHNQIQHVKRAASTFNVPESTLRTRRAGVPSRHDCEPKSKKLTKLEEEVIVEYILDLDSRGFAPTLDGVRYMANKLLAARDAGQVGQNWPRNFVKRTPQLTTRFNRPYDRQRALREDPDVISKWFERVQRMKEKYGILDEDTHNFDEAGFMMGKISSQLVVTGSERCNRPKMIQQGNREWATVIKGINATGWAIPPFVIFKAKHHDSAWYEDLPYDWAIGVSDSGWTNNELGVAWLRHFIKHTAHRKVGVYQMLIIDGHESHISDEFQDICDENKIIAICMPSHASHLLQPLDVGCFSPLKKAYGRQIEGLARNHINHITKLEFLPALKAALDQSITKDNICASFRGTGLVPYDPEAVLSKLDVKLRTPTPPAAPEAPWESKTPSNVRELDAQSKLVRDRIQRHQDSSPASIIQSLDQLYKGNMKMALEAALLRDRVKSLEKANDEATKRRKRKRTQFQDGGVLGKADMEDLMAQIEVDKQLEGELRQSGALQGKGERAQRHCRTCGETGHNSRTCGKSTQNAP